jgi:uncharacterized membrane protein YhhN
MSLILYSAGFWVFALIIILFKYTDFLQERFALRVIIKVVPALLAVVYVLLFRNSDALFYFIYAIALVFCALGDFGMEINILPGLGMFLFGHIIFIITFLWQSILIGITTTSLVIFGGVFIILLVYIILFRRYLSTSEKDTPKPLLRAVDVYALMISLTLSTSVLLWFTTNNVLGYIPVIGAIMFVISDTMIGIREFHHEFNYQNYLVYSTYYIAIYLLSLAVLIYLF